MKNPLTAGIDPATFRFVAQHLNLCYRGSPFGRTYCLHIQSFVNLVQLSLTLKMGAVRSSKPSEHSSIHYTAQKRKKRSETDQQPL